MFGEFVVWKFEGSIGRKCGAFSPHSHAKNRRRCYGVVIMMRISETTGLKSGVIHKVLPPATWRCCGEARASRCSFFEGEDRPCRYAP